MLMNYKGVQEIMAVRPFKVTIADCGEKRIITSHPVTNSKDANAVNISTNAIQNFLLGNLDGQDVDMILGTAYMQERVDLSYLEIKDISKASEINEKDIYFGEMNSLFPFSSNSFGCADTAVIVIDRHTGNVVNDMSCSGIGLPMY